MRNSSHPEKNAPDEQAKLVLIKKRNGSCMYIDEPNGIVKIAWVDVVDQETATVLIEFLSKLMGSGMFTKILMTRNENTHFTDDATIWMRNFILSNRYKFSYKISRIAGVTPHAARANIFANFIKTALQVIFPGIKIVNFEFEESAMTWLT